LSAAAAVTIALPATTNPTAIAIQASGS